MRLRRRFDPRKIFGIIVWSLLMGYVIVGLQPAEATYYTADNALNIPVINLVSDVTYLELHDNRLDTPDTIVGSYTRNHNKTLLIGHSTTVFKNLKDVELRDIINYDNKDYKVVKIEVTMKQNISMTKVIEGAERDTIVLMTCAGELLAGGDATHRLIITAVAL